MVSSIEEEVACKRKSLRAFLSPPPHYPYCVVHSPRMSKVQYLSAEGLEKLKAELHDLKTVKRIEFADRIEAAKALGDLSENAEYHDAKEQLSMLEARIFELDEIIKNASLIEDETGAKGVAHVGSIVVVRTASGAEKTFTIVGSNEADPSTGKISNESPIGNAILGAKKGDTVEVKTPAGQTTYEIVEVKS